MKSVQTYINAQAAARHYQQAEEQQIPQTQCGECNYDNDYYGDQVCLNKAR
ncbi:hypothetical protein [Bacterioplanoides sp. SCSIO 12839]|uniref:hypothetical protein n=1 Tax=Bacterioplanoides sp. SCSIO 12839 TaxID=2829569 RepID=UPI002103330B|nr:hypothetical protein [Bacterioplanoides sp. SCSIO 12839]UTW48018.1 hypothetical protein KFF03_15905 [Bacterioplanoides sp. SCSIO 12839]